MRICVSIINSECQYEVGMIHHNVYPVNSLVSGWGNGNFRAFNENT